MPSNQAARAVNNRVSSSQSSTAMADRRATPAVTVESVYRARMRNFGSGPVD
ncbi:hypothetical protein ABT187_05715 [Streptomyces sp. NPDC001817]|uniref:hypothetical protein n=1 Tax=Streptomyces sp. NPDC001817 TaxID=3154398 RepID=UPI0033299B79